MNSLEKGNFQCMHDKGCIHKMIDNNDGEQDYLEELCEKRWETMKQPCKGCKYRFPFPENKRRCCIFGTLPKDWKIFR